MQGIRALAIVAVLLFHFYPEHFPNGYLGVDQFFVMSGFLMSMILEREKNIGFREIGHFYYRRVRRILPSYLLVILFPLVASSCFLLQCLQVDNLNSAVHAVMFTTNIKAADSVRNYLKMVSSTKTTTSTALNGWHRLVSAKPIRTLCFYLLSRTRVQMYVHFKYRSSPYFFVIQAASIGPEIFAASPYSLYPTLQN
ncbi:unnamed protein product [Angiostrongylus costaricensis]|uniref:Acyltransferase 3 domain-containing protein n=1 Tax=Angiostrongylus costaricensis TaxID=334426 RepID=A0A3P7JUA2_ANGCS|nr:unnamed protein product [Angiostrongylus costaricensis]